MAKKENAGRGGIVITDKQKIDLITKGKKPQPEKTDKDAKKK